MTRWRNGVCMPSNMSLRTRLSPCLRQDAMTSDSRKKMACARLDVDTSVDELVISSTSKSAAWWSMSSTSFKKGESEFVLHRRRSTLAQIALEEHLRVTAYCTWSNTLISFRFNPVDWTLIHDTHQQQRYTFGTTQQIQLIVSRQTCAMSAFVTREQQCRSCAHPHWRAACEKPSFIRHILPVCNTRHQYDPSTRVRHARCDQTLAPLGPLPVDANDLGPWRKRLPTCNVRV